jgi:hypothetical protein
VVGLEIKEQIIATFPTPLCKVSSRIIFLSQRKIFISKFFHFVEESKVFFEVSFFANVIQSVRSMNISKNHSSF